MRKKNTKDPIQKKKVRKQHEKKHAETRDTAKKHRANRAKRRVTRKIADPVENTVPQPGHIAVEPWSSEQIGIDAKSAHIEEKAQKVSAEESKEIQPKRSFIDKNFNTYLMYFVGVCIILLLIVTLFYHSLFDIIGNKYDAKVEAIENLSEELNASIEELNETSIALTVREAREEELSGQYVEIRGVKEQLDIDLAEMTAIKEQLDIDLAETELLLEQERETTAQLNTQVILLQTQVSSLQSEVSKYKSRANTLEDQLDACEAAQQVP